MYKLHNLAEGSIFIIFGKPLIDLGFEPQVSVINIEK